MKKRQNFRFDKQLSDDIDTIAKYLNVTKTGLIMLAITQLASGIPDESLNKRMKERAQMIKYDIAVTKNKDKRRLYYHPHNARMNILRYASKELFMKQDIDMKKISKLVDDEMKAFQELPDFIQEDLKDDMDEVQKLKQKHYLREELRKMRILIHSNKKTSYALLENNERE